MTVSSSPGGCVALPHDRGAPAAARRLVARLADRIPAPLLNDVMLAASELATNAVIHSPPSPPPTIEVQSRGDRLSLVVTSAASEPFDERTRKAAPGATGGFGLRVVDAVASRWWVERNDVARVVCEFDLGVAV